MASRGGGSLGSAGRLGSVGLELGLAVVVGLVGGSWLDGKLGSGPWLALAGLVVGSVAGFRALARALKMQAFEEGQ